MSSIATTRMSFRGQVVIPGEIRAQYGWGSGTSFIVIGHADAIILQPVEALGASRFNALLAESRKAARDAGLTPRAITRAVRETRQARGGKAR